MLRRCTLALALALPACDTAPSQAAPKTEATTPKTDDAALAKRKAEREAAAKAEQEKADALAKTIDALAVVPDELPAKLEPACQQMLDAYDGFMRKVLTGDMLTKWETGGNEMQLAVFKKECLKRDIATAACQAHALSMAGPELEQQLPDLMQACVAKAAAAAQ